VLEGTLTDLSLSFACPFSFRPPFLLYSHEKDSEAHQIFRAQPGHKAKTEKDTHVVPGIEHPGSVGVIYVMDRAMASQ
jgi:hypothetical protein